MLIRCSFCNAKFKGNEDDYLCPDCIDDGEETSSIAEILALLTM